MNQNFQAMKTEQWTKKRKMQNLKKALTCQQMVFQKVQNKTDKFVKARLSQWSSEYIVRWKKEWNVTIQVSLLEGGGQAVSVVVISMADDNVSTKETSFSLAPIIESTDNTDMVKLAIFIQRVISVLNALKKCFHFSQWTTMNRKRYFSKSQKYSW